MKIIYKIYYEEELKAANLLQLEQEHNQIYGEFNIVFGSQYYLPYPTEETIGKHPEIFSELLLTHFDQMNLVCMSLGEQVTNYVAIRYIESPWVWLEYKRVNDRIFVSEIFHEDGGPNSYVSFEEEYFQRSKKEKIACIPLNELLVEVTRKTNSFIEELQKINPLLSESKAIKSFLSNTRRGDIR
ncbi:hypothetical protein [Paenibacillus agaridevorans]|uniref:hypothetical protein n=1 Tax=Paenibacillus agaridevorans TaxID=171404 RepID=UPI001BE4B1AE|nr:hypothetical protein [Paenibacillus agaridevorans]